MQLGLIGVGLVGSALAERFLTAGHQVLGFDIDSSRLQGMAAARSSAEVFDRCAVVFLSLPNSEIAGRIVREIDVPPQALLVDTTTGSPQETESLGNMLQSRNAGYVDATIGGSSEQVRRGESTVMCGGAAQDFERAYPLLKLFAKRIFHIGPCGSGARMKLVFNLVLGLNRAVLAEGLAFAEACGLDPIRALEVLQSGAAHSAVMDTKGDRMIRREFQPQARLAQHLKDVRLILAEAARSNAVTPLSLLHAELLGQAEAAGFGSADNSAVIEVFRRSTLERSSESS